MTRRKIRKLLRSIAESDLLHMLLFVYLYVLSSVTFVHPAKAVGRNEMPFGTDTRVV